MADFDKPSNTEDEYFAREEVEKKRKLALLEADRMAAAEKQKAKDLHFMHCPKCGMKLQTVQNGPVEIDSCFNCGGVFLDAGELEQIMNRKDAGPVMGAILGWFKKK